MAADTGVMAHLVRTVGFVRKELWSVIRQPRLILTLIVGPFVILLIFGFGYTEQVSPLRTLIVLESEEARFATDIDELSESFGSSIDLVGTTVDGEDALRRLEDSDVDLLVVAPEDALGSLQRGEKADFIVVHTEVDPILKRSIALLSTLSVDELNRRVLADVVEQIQATSDEAEAPVEGLSSAADGLVAALEAGDDEEAREQRDLLQAALTRATAQDRAGALYTGVSEALGIAAGGVLTGLGADLDGTDPENPDALENARSVRDRLTELEGQLGEAQDIDPALLVSPFGADVEALTETPAEPAIFYAPGVLMVLIQHLAVTFAGLSLVREREQGVTEIFRVSPLSVSEAMTGKYLAFGLIVGVVAVLLSGLMYLFGVPIAANLGLYSAVVGLVILASLGLGFIISALAQTDSQAIQYAMIVLLVSIFFSGFVIPLDRLLAPVQAVSFLIPATYGISALQDVVFRSVLPSTPVLAGLGAYVLAGAVLAWVLARRDISG